jgi:type VI secretion system secreted protein Hcp
VASDYFLKLDGIKGESRDAKHKDEIDLVAFSWGIANSGTTFGGGGAGAGKAVLTDFEVAMPVNRASPSLFQSCATGKHIPTGTLSVRRSGKEQAEYLKFKFTDLLITGYQESANVEEDAPLDVVRFNYAKIEMTYSPQKADGTLDAPVTGAFDFKSGKK